MYLDFKARNIRFGIKAVSAHFAGQVAFGEGGGYYSSRPAEAKPAQAVTPKADLYIPHSSKKESLIVNAKQMEKRLEADLLAFLIAPMPAGKRTIPVFFLLANMNMENMCKPGFLLSLTPAFKRGQFSPRRLGQMLEKMPLARRIASVYLNKLAEQGLVQLETRAGLPPFLLPKDFWSLTQKGQELAQSIGFHNIADYIRYQEQCQAGNIQPQEALLTTADGSSLKDFLQEQIGKLMQEKRNLTEKQESVEKTLESHRRMVARMIRDLETQKTAFEKLDPAENTDQYRLEQARLRQQTETVADESRHLQELERQLEVSKPVTTDALLQIEESIHEIRRRMKDLEIMKVQAETLAKADQQTGTGQEQVTQLTEKLREIQIEAAAREAAINEQSPELRSRALEVIRRRIAEKEALQTPGILQKAVS